MCDCQAAVSLAELMVLLTVLQPLLQLKKPDFKGILMQAQMPGVAVVVCTTHEVSLLNSGHFSNADTRIPLSFSQEIHST